VLRPARRLPATAAVILALLAGASREAARTMAAEYVADQAEPGAIGVRRRTQPGPRPESFLPEHMQPVEISGPEGMLISIETASGWSPMQPAPLRMGLMVGEPYRLRIGGVVGREGEELFPSVRGLAKLAAPRSAAASCGAWSTRRASRSVPTSCPVRGSTSGPVTTRSRWRARSAIRSRRS